METRTKIKSVLVLAFMVLCGINANAQATPQEENYDQGFRLGFGLNGGYVTEDPYDFSLGADVRLQYDFTKKTSITLTTGFTNLFVGDDMDDLGFIPVKAGFKGFVWEDQFYLLGEIGGAFPVTNDYDKNSLLFSPGIGWVPSKYLDLSIRYEYYNEFLNADGDKGVGQVALRIAYGFRL